MNSAEYANRINGAQQSGTMSSSNQMVAELQTLNTRIASMEGALNKTAMSTGKFADQFDSVSGGGNMLLMEQAQ